MSAEARRDQLLEVIRNKRFASLPDLAEILSVSESTIRRDLDQLEENGTTRRTHGGVLYAGPAPNLKHFESKPSEHWEKKRKIAHRAAAMVADGDTVLLDGGSTTYELAQRLTDRQLQVVTNSLPVANLFIGSSTVEVVMIGGYVHDRTGVTLGPYAVAMLRDLNVRTAILSVAGLTEKGYYNSNLLLVETERAMMEAADQVVIVADSTKLGRSSLAKLCDLLAIDSLIIDDEITEDWRSRLLAAGVPLVVALDTC
jgi:DeoR/GlpR family transcriptional regulator of sugar metabolism